MAIFLESVLLLLHERHRVIFVTKVLHMWLPTYVRGPTKSLFMLSWYVLDVTLFSPGNN